LTSTRKLIAFFCLVAVLWAALAPVSTGLLWAIVVPLLFLIEILAVVWAERHTAEKEIPLFFCLVVVAPRAPPASLPLI